ncbi:hypothetical protein D3C74_305950 [compost metagenome]
MQSLVTNILLSLLLLRNVFDQNVASHMITINDNRDYNNTKVQKFTTHVSHLGHVMHLLHPMIIPINGIEFTDPFYIDLLNNLINGTIHDPCFRITGDCCYCSINAFDNAFLVY